MRYVVTFKVNKKGTFNKKHCPTVKSFFADIIDFWTIIDDLARFWRILFQNIESCDINKGQMFNGQLKNDTWLLDEWKKIQYTNA